jgi:serine/threonine protein kinase
LFNVAPEMFIHKPYTYSVDWWALGIVLYECTFSKHPFQGSGPIEKAIINSPILIPNQYEVTPGRFPYVESEDRNDFIRRLLVRSVHERLGCGPQGNLEIRNHSWFSQIDWHALLQKKVIPDFIPDPSQSNYDFGAALEELLYESSPLASKPVKKRKDKNPPISLKMLWADESVVSRKQNVQTKLDQELDYIDQYFEPYIKPSFPLSNSTQTLMPLIEMPPTQKEYSKSKSKSSSNSRKSLDAVKMLMEEQQAFRIGQQSLGSKKGDSPIDTFALPSFEIDESAPPIPSSFVYRENGILNVKSRDSQSGPMLYRMAPNRPQERVDSKLDPGYPRGYSPSNSLSPSVLNTPSAGGLFNSQTRTQPSKGATSKLDPGYPTVIEPSERNTSSGNVKNTTPQPLHAKDSLKLNTKPKPMEIFDNAIRDLDLSFPDKPEMTPSPKSPKKKHKLTNSKWD